MVIHLIQNSKFKIQSSQYFFNSQFSILNSQLKKMLFEKQTYVQRRTVLKEQVGSGIILLTGNNDSPANYPANAYRFRQDSSFLYYFGQHREGLAGIIDIDNNREYLVGNDIDIEDIVWFGSVDSVADMAAQSGVAKWHRLVPYGSQIIEYQITVRLVKLNFGASDRGQHQQTCP